jgi:hypothetical protein
VHDGCTLVGVAARAGNPQIAAPWIDRERRQLIVEAGGLGAD